MDKLTELKFLMFENEKNNCWLDASVALIAHNQTFRKLVSSAPNCQIKKIISTHDKAVSILNDSDSNIDQRMKITREMLQEIQTSTLRYLQQFLKCKDGEPDSAFCAVLNLIYQDKSIKEHFNASCLWKKLCTNCGNSSAGSFVKPIITLSKVNSFQPEYPNSIYMCSCKTEQEMKIVYKELPSCLIFHFEKGAGDGKKFPLVFTVKERKYQLTGVITLEKSNDPNVNHFVTWIRDPSTNMWLDCNDLNTSIVSFSSIQPDWNLKDVYMYVFESFDNLGKVSNEVLADQDQNVENINVEVIDLEAEEVKNTSENATCKNSSSKLCPRTKNATTSVANFIQNPINDSNTEKPKEAVFMSKKEKTASTSTQNLKMAGRKNHLDISDNKIHVTDKETRITSIRDCRNTSLSNLRFTVPPDMIPAKYACESEYRSYQSSDKIKDEPTRVDIKVKFISDDSSSAKNINSVDANKNKENSSISRISLTRKAIQSQENNEKKKTSGNLLSGIERLQLLHADLYKSSDKLNFKSTSSDTIKKVGDVNDHSFSGKRTLNQSIVKDASFVKSELNPSQINLGEQHLARDDEKCESDSEKNLLEKRQFSIQQSPKNSVEDASVEFNKQRNINTSSRSNFQKAQQKTEIVPYSGSTVQAKKGQTLAEESGEKVFINSDQIHSGSGHLTLNASFLEESSHKKSLIRKYYGHQLSKTFLEDTAKSESEETETSEYDENELQLKMQQTSLKRTENQGASSSKKRKVLNNQKASSNTEADVDDSKTAMKKSSRRTSKSENPKYKKRTSERRASSDKEQDFKNAHEETINQSDKDEDDVKSQITSYDRKAMDQKIEKIVDTVVERTFAAFLEQLIVKRQSVP